MCRELPRTGRPPHASLSYASAVSGVWGGAKGPHEHAAKDEQGKQEARIRTLQALLKNATVGVAPESTGVVESGTVVTAVIAGGEEVFLLGNREIGAGSELDVYSEASPLGSAILGLKEGDKTSYTAPNGREITVEIVKVETYDGQ